MRLRLPPMVTRRTHERRSSALRGRPHEQDQAANEIVVVRALGDSAHVAGVEDDARVGVGHRISRW